MSLLYYNVLLPYYCDILHHGNVTELLMAISQENCIQYPGQFTPKMKENAELHLPSSLVRIDSGVVVSQHRLESFFIK